MDNQIKRVKHCAYCNRGCYSLLRSVNRQSYTFSDNIRPVGLSPKLLSDNNSAAVAYRNSDENLLINKVANPVRRRTGLNLLRCIETKSILVKVFRVIIRALKNYNCYVSLRLSIVKSGKKSSLL